MKTTQRTIIVTRDSDYQGQIVIWTRSTKLRRDEAGVWGASARHKHFIIPKADIKALFGIPRKGRKLVFRVEAV